MIDTHSHIDGEEFVDDLEDVLSRARQAGVNKIFVPGICMKDTSHLLEVCQAHSDLLYPMVGLHPENVMDEDFNQVLDSMEKIIEEDSTSHIYNIIGVGETGLDFYWDDTYRNQQIESLERQIHWAGKFDLPLMLHVRKAHNEIVEMMKRHNRDGLRGVFHCFSGSREMAQDLLAFPDFMLGIGGILTFKKSKLPEVLKTTVPLSRIVLETDSPYMAPTPYRGGRNESAYVVEVAKMLADIYGISLEEIDRITTENALGIFGNAVK